MLTELKGSSLNQVVKVKPVSWGHLHWRMCQTWRIKPRVRYTWTEVEPWWQNQPFRGNWRTHRDQTWGTKAWLVTSGIGDILDFLYIWYICIYWIMIFSNLISMIDQWLDWWYHYRWKSLASSFVLCDTFSWLTYCVFCFCGCYCLFSFLFSKSIL